MALLCLALLLGLPGVSAQDLEPRSYTNIPVGEHFLLLGATRSEGGLAPTPSSPLEDADLTIDSLVFGYATSFELLA